MKQTAVWVDHQRAYIFDYQSDGIHERIVEAQHDGKMSKEHLRKFYHDLAHAIQGSKAILLMGPGQAKEEFKNHCEEHHHEVNKAIVKVENMKDHPSVKQILKASNKFFKEQNAWQGI